jgi:hypothetical protein
LLKSKTKPLLANLGLVCLIIGFVIGIAGFGVTITSTWASTYLISGLADFLLGLLFLLLGIGLISYGKN